MISKNMSMMYINGPLVNSQSQSCQLHGFFPRQVGKEALPLAQEFAKQGTLRGIWILWLDWFIQFKERGLY